MTDVRFPSASGNHMPVGKSIWARLWHAATSWFDDNEHLFSNGRDVVTLVLLCIFVVASVLFLCNCVRLVRLTWNFGEDPTRPPANKQKAE